MIENKAPKPGEIFRNPHLARTLRDLADKGRDGFYKGRVAQAIVEISDSLGGTLTLEVNFHFY